MSGRRLRNLLALAVLVAVVAKLVQVLRGDPAPAFSRHPTVDGGIRPPSPPAGVSLVDALAPKPDATRAPDEERSGPDDDRGAASPTPSTSPDDSNGAWVTTDDATCPEGYPVKVKLKSGIFHLPGMLAYDRTQPDRCYASAEAATADGFRPAKR